MINSGSCSGDGCLYVVTLCSAVRRNFGRISVESMIEDVVDLGCGTGGQLPSRSSPLPIGTELPAVNESRGLDYLHDVQVMLYAMRG